MGGEEVRVYRHDMVYEDILATKVSGGEGKGEGRREGERGVERKGGGIGEGGEGRG